MRRKRRWSSVLVLLLLLAGAILWGVSGRGIRRAAPTLELDEVAASGIGATLQMDLPQLAEARILILKESGHTTVYAKLDSLTPLQELERLLKSEGLTAQPKEETFRFTLPDLLQNAAPWWDPVPAGKEDTFWASESSDFAVLLQSRESGSRLYARISPNDRATSNTISAAIPKTPLFWWTPMPTRGSEYHSHFMKNAADQGTIGK